MLLVFLICRLEKCSHYVYIMFDSLKKGMGVVGCSFCWFDDGYRKDKR